MTRIPFDNTYARLPERFFTQTRPTPVRTPRLIRLNRPLASHLGIDPDWLASAAAEIFSGNGIPEGAEPISQAYAGHQFGNFVPRLGDGRAILLGEVLDQSGIRRDVQLKGAGRTPWSRGGDGRAAIGPVLREYVVSEAMAALGIRTTRSLAAVTTGEVVIREELLPGAVLTRVASSHIRVGTFEYFWARRDVEGLRLLADYVIARHYPDAAQAERPYRALLDAVIRAQAELIASWLLIGFIHGVMNTDNMSVSGETIDYGPCAFMDEYDPNTVFSSIDRHGRYAYGNQPGIGGWNLTRFAETLLPLLSDNVDAAVAEANEALSAYAAAFDQAYLAGLRRKFGFFTEDAGDMELAQDFLKSMHANRADFTNTFRKLADAATGDSWGVRTAFMDPTVYDAWEQRWKERLAQESIDPAERRNAMRRANPAFIPRNHRVEAVIRAAIDDDDFGPFEELTTLLEKPFDDQPELAHYAQPPQDEERVLQTFCGT
ncbi:MAG: YdiU family protein [Acidobacteriota bacterium]|nr:YdiU family protein [Acidobacteriota bacterium]